MACQFFKTFTRILNRSCNRRPMLFCKRKRKDMHVQFSNPLGNRNRVSGFLRLFIFSLLTAAFAFTSLHAQTVAYVTNNGSNTVSVIDTSSNTVTATIPVASAPLGVAFSPD